MTVYYTVLPILLAFSGHSWHNPRPTPVAIEHFQATATSPNSVVNTGNIGTLNVQTGQIPGLAASETANQNVTRPTVPPQTSTAPQGTALPLGWLWTQVQRQDGQKYDIFELPGMYLEQPSDNKDNFAALVLMCHTDKVNHSHLDHLKLRTLVFGQPLAVPYINVSSNIHNTAFVGTYPTVFVNSSDYAGGVTMTQGQTYFLTDLSKLREDIFRAHVASFVFGESLGPRVGTTTIAVQFVNVSVSPAMRAACGVK